MTKSNLCKNCNSELMGIYCSECGQKNTELLSVKAIVKELTDNVFSFDSRFFITLKYLIIKPGFLTKEYLRVLGFQVDTINHFLDIGTLVLEYCQLLVLDLTFYRKLIFE